MWPRQLDAWETQYPVSVTEFVRELICEVAGSTPSLEEQLVGSLRVDADGVILTYSGTAAIEAALSMVSNGGSEVIVPDYICPYVAEGILRAGCTPVPVDVTWPELTIDPDRVRSARGRDSVAVLAAHHSGVPAPIQTLRQRTPELVILEDTAQGLGSRLPSGEACGTLGNLSVLSFSNKHLACGKGGALLVRDMDGLPEFRRARVREQIGSLHLNTRSPIGTVIAGLSHLFGTETHGFRRRLGCVNRALVGAQLPHLKQLNRWRQRHAEVYADRLGDIADESDDIELLTPLDPDIKPLHYLAAVPPERKTTILAELRRRGVHAWPGWVPISASEYASSSRISHERPVTAKAHRRVIGLPLSPGASKQRIAAAANSVHDVLRSSAS